MYTNLNSSAITQELSPLLLVRFDQVINPDLVLPLITLVSEGSRPAPVPLSRVPLAEVEAHSKEEAKQVASNMAIALRPAAPLVKATNYKLKVAAKLPSTEGPLLNLSEHTALFSTYGPLKIMDHSPIARYPGLRA
jgi:hypothetical protein